MSVRYLSGDIEYTVGYMSNIVNVSNPTELHTYEWQK